jgi:hypothetical protein
MRDVRGMGAIDGDVLVAMRLASNVRTKLLRPQRQLRQEVKRNHRDISSIVLDDFQFPYREHMLNRLNAALQRGSGGARAPTGFGDRVLFAPLLFITEPVEASTICQHFSHSSTCWAKASKHVATSNADGHRLMVSGLDIQTMCSDSACDR